MASSSTNILWQEETDNVLNVQLTDSDTSVFDSDDSSLINDLPVQDAIAIEESENEG
jgi:hypothetical protein